MNFDTTISLGNIIASLAFLVSTGLGVHHISRAIRDRNDARLDELEKQMVVVLSDLQWIRKSLEELNEAR